MRITKTPDLGDTSWAARLRRYRVTKNLTIEAAAQRFKVKPATWAGWEARNREPRFCDETRKLDDALTRNDRDLRKNS